MKSSINYTPRRSAGSFLVWWSRLCLLLGLAGIGWVAYVWLDAHIYQIVERRQLDALVSARKREPPAVAQVPVTQAPILKLPRLGPGSVLGELEIPRIGLSVIVIEGDSASILRRAAGHLEGTAVPGGPGNVAIAAHRDTFFHPLRGICDEDVITLNTLRGSYKYRVESIEVVEPDDVEVLADSSEPTMTLITCYPFSYIGPAPKRLVVRARQIALESPAEIHGLQRDDRDSPAQTPD
jgi:sortase A